MGRLTVVLTAAILPSLGAWNDEMRESGFDVVLDPHPRYDDSRSVPVIVYGQDAVVEFELIAAARQAGWFPLGMLQVRQATWVALFEWREGKPLEHAAAYLAAAALAKLTSGLVFEADGIRGELADAAYLRARGLLAGLADKPGRTGPTG